MQSLRPDLPVPYRPSRSSASLQSAWTAHFINLLSRSQEKKKKKLRKIQNDFEKGIQILDKAANTFWKKRFTYLILRQTKSKNEWSLGNFELSMSRGLFIIFLLIECSFFSEVCFPVGSQKLIFFLDPYSASWIKCLCQFILVEIFGSSLKICSPLVSEASFGRQQALSPSVTHHSLLLSNHPLLKNLINFWYLAFTYYNNRKCSRQPLTSNLRIFHWMININSSYFFNLKNEIEIIHLGQNNLNWLSKRRQLIINGLINLKIENFAPNVSIFYKPSGIL